MKNARNSSKKESAFTARKTATCIETARRGPRVKAKAKEDRKVITLNHKHEWLM
jgi:hypothetical protein